MQLDKIHKHLISLLFLLLTTLTVMGIEVPSDKIRITGTVLDQSTSEVLIGANVVIENTNIGTSTNHLGEFELVFEPRKNISLVISMVGYQSKEIPVKVSAGNHLQVDVELKSGIIEMGSIVVTGTNTPHLYSEVPVKTEVINRLSIERRHAVNLAEALNLQTGLSVDNECNNCNFTQVKILGFDGKYSQILIDGDPVVSSLGGVYGLEHYPKEMIEQIEIVKGGGSSLYGAGAISGTVNLMTRQPSFNQTRIGYLGSSISGSYDQQLGAVAELVSDDGRTGAFIFGSTRDRNPYDHNGDGFTEVGELKNETIGFNFYHRPNTETELKVSLHRIHEHRRGGSDLNKPIHEARTGEWTDHSKWGGKLTWDQKINDKFDYRVNYSFSLLKRDSYYGGLSENTPEGKLEALNYYGFSNNPLHNGGVQANYKLGDHQFIAGFQFLRDDILDQSVSSEAYYIDEVFTNYGFYLQDEWSLTDDNNTIIVYGVRIDKHSKLSNAILSPRINLKYTLFDNFIFRAGYTTGFKAPQIFDEDLHICGLEGEQRVIRNDENLKEESSHSFNAGFEFQDFVGETALLVGFTTFYTTLADAYSEVYVKSEPTFDLWKRVNSGGAEVMGLELDLGIKPTNDLEIRSGITYKKNEYEEALADFNTKNFLRTPDLFGHTSITYKISKVIDCYSSFKYTGSMYMPHEIVVDGAAEPELLLKTTEEFFVFDAGLSLNLNIINSFKTKLSFGIKNLTNAYQNDLDRGINRDPGYVYGPASPRTFYFGIDTSF